MRFEGTSAYVASDDLKVAPLDQRCRQRVGDFDRQHGLSGRACTCSSGLRSWPGARAANPVEHCRHHRYNRRRRTDPGVAWVVQKASRVMVDGETELEMTARHVAQARWIVARQRELIKRLRATGIPTRRHEQTLSCFEGTLACFEDHQRMLNGRPVGKSRNSN
jgi:hypothetical protein